MESWDDDNFEPPSIVPAAPVVNKWEGEDEDDDVKDNWEDEDEERKEEQKVADLAKKSKKKLLSEKIAEKEKSKRDEEKRLQELDDEDDLSPEERMRRQQESDLKLALETTFSTGDSLGDLPTSKDDLQEFGENLSKKVLSMSMPHAEFTNFTENLIRNLCAGMPSQEIRKIKNSVDNLYLEKQKMEKGDKVKKNKGKGKVKLKVDDANPLSAYVNEYDDYNDFM